MISAQSYRLDRATTLNDAEIRSIPHIRWLLNYNIRCNRATRPPSVANLFQWNSWEP